MIKDLELLVQLQSIDSRIHAQIQSQCDLPRALADLERTVTKSAKAVDSVNKQLAANAEEKKSFEEKVADAKIALDKSQDRLNSIKTNREYDAVHAEIETFRNIIAGADAKTKTLLADEEKLQQSLDAAKADHEKLVAESDPKLLDLKSKIASVDSRVVQLRMERTEISAGIPKSLLRTYDQILSRKKNAKVLSFVGNDNCTCSSCFKVLETQLINEIRRGTKLLTCQNCGAIFVWGENPEEKKADAPSA